MNNTPNDIDWNQIRALLATVEAGSLSGAARQLGLTQPTLGRQVAALEESLGVTLFERTGRRLVLTQAGQELVGPLKAMGDAAARVAFVASRQSQDIEGVVKVTASDIYAYYLLPPVIERLRDLAPGLVVDVVTSNAVEDLIRRKADIAIRHVQPREAELIAQRCPDSTARLYARGDYLDKIGRPGDAAGLARAEFIGFSGQVPVMLKELRQRGLPLAEDRFTLLSNSGLVAWDWARRGLGIAVMTDSVARLTPDVEDAWPGFSGIPVPTWLATHRELRTSRRIRLVFDVIAEELGGARQAGQRS